MGTQSTYFYNKLIPKTILQLKLGQIIDYFGKDISTDWYEFLNFLYRVNDGSYYKEFVVSFVRSRGWFMSLMRKATAVEPSRYYQYMGFSDAPEIRRYFGIC